MVKLIMGLKGSGKTKHLVDLVRETLEQGKGDVVVIEKERKLTYDIPYQARLVDAGAYGIDTYELLKGMLCGMHAGNYDITQVFIDNLCKIVGTDVNKDTEDFLNWLDLFGERNNIKFTATISAETSDATDGMQKFL